LISDVGVGEETTPIFADAEEPPAILAPAETPEEIAVAERPAEEASPALFAIFIE
jgi:hypothetical protein